MMNTVKTLIPAPHVAYLLERYASEKATEAEWIEFLESDAEGHLGDRQIPYSLCDGKRYYDFGDVFQFVSNRDAAIYLEALAAELKESGGAGSGLYARTSFDANRPQEGGFVELVIPTGHQGNVRLTTEEANLFARYLQSQADLADAHVYEEYEYQAGNVNEEMSLNALLAALEMGTPTEICATTGEAA